MVLFVSKRQREETTGHAAAAMAAVVMVVGRSMLEVRPGSYIWNRAQ